MKTTYFLYLIIFLSTCGLSPLVIKFLEKMDAYDAVNHRSAHSKLTLRGGGLSFILIITVAIFLNNEYNWFPMPKDIYRIGIFSTIIAAFSFFDDIYSVRPVYRLMMQLAVVVYPSAYFPVIFNFIPHIVQHISYIIIWLWFINLYNFMDGTNGFACQQAVFICLFISLLPVGLTAVSLIILFTVLGFLPYNFPKAKVFMGDTGSIYLGYLLGGLLLYAMTHFPNLSSPIISITLLFSADASYTLIGRALNSENIFKAHCSHWYQRMHRSGRSHVVVFLCGAGINALIISMYFILTALNFTSLMLPLSFLLIIGFWLFIRFQELKLEKKGPHKI